MVITQAPWLPLVLAPPYTVTEVNILPELPDFDTIEARGHHLVIITCAPADGLCVE